MLWKAGLGSLAMENPMIDPKACLSAAGQLLHGHKWPAMPLAPDRP